MTDEEYVRSKWEEVSTGAAALHLSDYCAPTVIHGNEFPNWQAARQFTEQREREIDEVDEEIATLQSLIVPFDKLASLVRCAKRAEEARAELKKGMKP